MILVLADTRVLILRRIAYFTLMLRTKQSLLTTPRAGSRTHNYLPDNTVARSVPLIVTPSMGKYELGNEKRVD
jgi:hypothetical protein